mgnify:CR=1 FL=1
MSDELKHECGIAHIRLLKSLDFYKKKYGSAFYGINKMYLLMEKQHNRGQDGAGFASIKLNVEPGKRFISRIRSIEKQPIQDVFSKINTRINSDLKNNPNLAKNTSKLKASVPYLAESLLGHVRYGTFGGNSVENVQPLLRQNNWKHRNLILAGNFNMTNVAELFNNLIELGQHPKEYSDMVSFGLSGNQEIANQLHNKLYDFYVPLYAEGNPVGIKACLELLGICKCFVRPPLVGASDIIKNELGIELNCGIGTGKTARSAVKLATKSLDTIREIRDSGKEKPEIYELT